MVSCDTCFLTLVLVSTYLIVVSTGETSWDIAVTHGQQIDFFLSNGKKTDQFEVPNVQSLMGLAFDNKTKDVYVSDKNSNDVSVLLRYSPFSSEMDVNPEQMFRYENESVIPSIAFDSISRTLFWTDSWLHTLMKVEISPDGKLGNPIVVHNLAGHTPAGIALDICNGYVYWANNDKTVHSIERMKLDGTGREEIVYEGLQRVFGLAIDLHDDKLYWADDIESAWYEIQTSNLDGSNKTLFYKGLLQEPGYIAVDRDTVYWTDFKSNQIYKMNKNKGPRDEPEQFTSYQILPKIMSIITRDNAGNINCAALKEERKNSANNKTIVENNKAQSSDNLPNSGKEINSFTKSKIIKECLNNGRYNVTVDICVCEKGFKGKLCEIDLCLNYCIHGSCYINDDNSPRCYCGTSYSGDKCENDICYDYCLNNGTCSVTDNEPSCKCENSWGTRCEYSNKLNKLCVLYCSGDESVFNNSSVAFCGCSGQNNGTLSAAVPFMPSITITFSVLITVIGLLVIVVGVLSYHINKLRRRPRIRKRFVVSKGGVTPLTSRPQAPTDSCEITIENCCNMNICETPCFEPKLRTTPTKSSSTKKEEKSSLLDGMEGADSC